MIRNVDIHKNFFKNYNDKFWLENNITKAFLVTFNVLKTDKKIEMLKEFKLIENDNDLKECKDDLKIDVYLQKKPNENELSNIRKLDENSVKLLALSPTGKAWDKKLLKLDDIRNSDKLEKNICVIAKMLEPEIDQILVKDEERYKETMERAKNEFDDILKNYINKNRENAGSVPDGWIIIKHKGEIKNAIILENKKWDLDPYQLKNHIEKSLNKEYNERYLSFVKYDKIYEFFTKCIDKNKNECEDGKDIIILDFLEYLTVLGYEPIDNDLRIMFDEGDVENFETKSICFSNITKTYVDKRVDNIIENKYNDNDFLYKKSSNQLYPGINNDNINIFYDVYIDHDELVIDISSEIGVRYKDFNIELMGKIKDDDSVIEELGRIYRNCKWCRFCKIGQVAGVKYLNIKEFENLKEYLKEIESSKGIYRRLSKKEIINEFKDYEDSFVGFNDGEKGVLEYLRILYRKKYKKDDVIKYAELKKYIIDETDRHINGLKYINKLVNG